jgi:predicted XRE-type DNA-binding protein
MATQSHSRVLSEVEQGGLLLSRSPRVPEVEEVSVASIGRKQNLLAAINYCIEVSGLDDKEIALALGIDAGHLSNIRKGKPGCNFPTNKLDDLMTLCGNEVPLIWQALKRGKGLVMLESEAQRQIRLLHEQLADERKKNEVLVQAIHGRAA